MPEIYIHGFKTIYEESAKEGMNYLLYDLNLEEARVFFDQARLKKTAKFEDDEDRNYSLLYNGNNVFTLTRI